MGNEKQKGTNIKDVFTPVYSEKEKERRFIFGHLSYMGICQLELWPPQKCSWVTLCV